MDRYRPRRNKHVKLLSEAFKKGIVQRITRNLLDVQVLRLIQTQPMWGYMIKKQAEARFGVRLRHGVLYPLLNTLERENFLTSEKQESRGRVRKVYAVTRKGKIYLETYRDILQEQLQDQDLK